MPFNPGKRIIPPHLMRRLVKAMDRRAGERAAEHFDRETHGILTGEGEVAGFALQYEAPDLTLGTANVEGSGFGVIPPNSTIHAFTDAPGPSPTAPTAAPGTRLTASRDDHQHVVQTIWQVLVASVPPIAGQVLQALSPTVAAWTTPPLVGKYRSYTWEKDGAGSWGFVTEVDGVGDTVPAIELWSLE